jgi:flagellar biosynthetic protein FlhB
MAAENKTEQATPRKRQKAREKGQVARSRELVSGLATMAGALLLGFQFSGFSSAWQHLLRQSLDGSISATRIPSSLMQACVLFRPLAILLGLTWMVAGVAGVAQGGLVFAPAALSPTWSRLSPSARFQQLFSITSVSRLLKSLFPAAAVVYIGVSVLLRDWPRLPVLLSWGPRSFVRFSAAEIFEIAWKSALALLIWSLFDYLLERARFERDLRMSRQDLVDEFKETEGNPTVKARIRRLQRQVRRRRMLKDVERAAVVITNPTEFAVALEFSPSMSAPIVIAKARNLLAAEIKQVARWHGIPLVENPPLAHALYRAVEVGQSIPPKLYRIVAEVLAAIYRLQSQSANAKREGAHR